jgi:hypothetical protein
MCVEVARIGRCTKELEMLIGVAEIKCLLEKY